ncbi:MULTISPECIES: TnsD family transposase [unclassified Lysinibacillus]|uniref:TnsD family transposase n=1 Tax=unclassified Lysinibacillus TaxID=2636778 RepID=UPI00380510AF
MPFFTNPYPNELIYSAISRYHFYSGNIDYKDTMEELFQNRSVIPSMEIGSHFSILAEHLGSNYTVESILAQHTVFPYYSNFLTKQRYHEIIKDVTAGGQGLYTRLGMVAGGICRKNGLYYCAECAKIDVEYYGEPYIHREHQLQGINYCPHHELPLQKYEAGIISRIEYIRFKIDKMNLAPVYEVDTYAGISIHLAKQSYKLLQQPLHQLSMEEVTLKYRTLLREINLVTVFNRLRQKELYQAFQSKLTTTFLEEFECSLDIENEYSWLKVITRNSKRHVHPFRHLIMLYFLEIDIEDFIHQNTDEGPFGVGPFPCLNIASPHYKQRVITKVAVTRDYKTKYTIGTFTCACGFIYARKGPDMSKEDQYRIGRVKAFGEVWQANLEELAKENMSIRATAKKLGVDSKTVKKYMNTEKTQQEINTPDKTVPIEKYKLEILRGINEFKQISRTELRGKFKKQYMFLYRHDKEWLMDVLPSKIKMQQPNKKVDWSKRDQDYVKKIKRLNRELLELKEPIRITKSLIGRYLGILANLERHLDKLPRTERLLSVITETVQKFQLRRCYIIIDEMIIRNEPVLLWKVQRLAALKSHHFHDIKSYLENYVQQRKVVEEK